MHHRPGLRLFIKKSYTNCILYLVVHKAHFLLMIPRVTKIQDLGFHLHSMRYELSGPGQFILHPALLQLPWHNLPGHGKVQAIEHTRSTKRYKDTGGYCCASFWDMVLMGTRDSLDCDKESVSPTINVPSYPGTFTTQFRQQTAEL